MDDKSHTSTVMSWVCRGKPINKVTTHYTLFKVSEIVFNQEATAANKKVESYDK